ncbi:MAG: prepilin-type N-terminal cleavage/methylation domain-containing protein [bacterium]|nr:prepilin-type N-terminal cleavage/methylation domain-containing protein [bacterium]
MEKNQNKKPNITRLWWPNSKFQIPNSREGQSLIEILVGIAIMSIFLTGAAIMMINIIKIGKTNRSAQTAQDLASELLDNVKAINSSNWQNLYSLSPKGSSTPYYATTTLNGLQVTTGQELLTIDNMVFTRYFYIENVCRDSSGGTDGTGVVVGVSDTLVCSPAFEDPSSQRVTVRVTWLDSDGKTLTEFITRFANAVTSQASWQGGPVGDSVSLVATTTFASSSNIDFSSSTGAIQIQNP